jgi:hypothetical protein
LQISGIAKRIIADVDALVRHRLIAPTRAAHGTLGER